jgi:XTP/dITP diphosphohydrolase
MSSLIFATNNFNKVQEIRSVLPNWLQIITLQEAGILVDIPEPHPTIEGNAIEKVNFIYSMKKVNCFGEDTGLEVEALNGQPGVKSARYAGEGKNSWDNIELLLKNLGKNSNRNAQFKTVIALRFNGELHTFTGICKGIISVVPNGEKGFGYDPIFVPDGSDKTFAQMSLEEKNKFSHRKKATQQLIDFFITHGKN